MDAGWLNVGSFVLGLAAIGLPLLCFIFWLAGKQCRPWYFVQGSLAACAVALYLQIAYSDHLVEIWDWSALLDTSAAVKLIAGGLLAATLVLNAALMVYGKIKQK